MMMMIIINWPFRDGRCTFHIRNLLKPKILFYLFLAKEGPPLWSSGQCSWLLHQRSRVGFPALAAFLRNSGSGTGPIQPFEGH
jgi:hypothetical protein